MLYRLKKLALLFVFLVSTVFSPLSASPDFNKVLASLAEAVDGDLSQVIFEKMGGGQTNDNYKMVTLDDVYFIRCSLGQNDLLGCSLEQEWECSRLTSAAGLSPRAILYLPEEGVIVNEFIETHGRKVDLKKSPDIKMFCELLRKLHRLEGCFKKTFDPYEVIYDYAKKTLAVGGDLPQEIMDEVLPMVARLRETKFFIARSVPCHLDLHQGNILDNDKSFYLIDWEYAAMGDPFFDLATLATMENQTDEEMKEFLQEYLEGREPTPDEMNHFYEMRILSDARWALWYYLQAKISVLDVPYKEHGDKLLAECLKRIRGHNY
jgi:thiamine kinase-like enzyme